MHSSFLSLLALLQRWYPPSIATTLQTVGIVTKDEDKLFTRLLRHVDVHQHWLRKEVADGCISVPMEIY
jgi:putative NIF3 family GTP cyclohydrolase 1 type 2